MIEKDVKLCLLELKKKCEGFDRIPVCMLLVARVALLTPLAVLFNEIYKFFLTRSGIVETVSIGKAFYL